MDTPMNIMLLLYIMMMNVEQTTLPSLQQTASSSGPSAMQDQQAPSITREDLEQHTVHEHGQSSNQHRKDIVDDTSKQQISNIIPIGYKFEPTDPELIFHYLQKKVLQEPILNKVFQNITATEFFAKHPKELVPNLYKERIWYYFIQQDDDKVTQIRSNNRATYWKSEIKDITRIENPKHKQEIGYKTTYRCYHRCADGKEKKTHWRMEEFRFDKKVQTEWILARLIKGMDY